MPRIPGGEITPEKLIVIGEVARDFGLYTKITGGQRIDLFGARVDQLPLIWTRLVDAGFESGHAYGKALRTVKSCVGQTWCRYGVQDSVRMAIDLELRYRGLRSPHKLKSAVSGCARECAEARGKDFGIIATAQGWNLYVGGNGGATPRHADLLAQDLSDAELVRLIDRFLMFYIRTADRLERTSTWLDRIEGGLDHVRDVVVHDSLGLCDELEPLMADHVARLPRRMGRDHRRPGAAAALRLLRQRARRTRPVGQVRPRARPGQARPRHPRGPGARRPYSRRDLFPMTTPTVETAQDTRTIQLADGDGWFTGLRPCAADPGPRCGGAPPGRPAGRALRGPGGAGVRDRQPRPVHRGVRPLPRAWSVPPGAGRSSPRRC